MTKKQAEIIKAYANSSMNINETAKRLYMAAPTVGYHLTKIQEQMGWNPRNFFDLCYLVGVAEQRIGGKCEQD